MADAEVITKPAETLSTSQIKALIVWTRAVPGNRPSRLGR
jgi:hypothetical protein